MADQPPSSENQPASTVAGLEDVRRAVKTARRVFLVSDPAALAPERLTKRAASRLFEAIQSGARPVVVTARTQGPDLVIRTIQWLGDESRLAPPRKLSPDSDDSSSSGGS